MSVRTIINIGLNGPMSVESTKRWAKAWLSTLNVDFYVEDRSHPVLDADHEPALVVVFFNAPLAVITKDQIDKLCRSTGQDCIALKVVLHDSEVGMLLGPHTAPWQPYDEDKFLNPLRRFT